MPAVLGVPYNVTLTDARAAGRTSLLPPVPTFVVGETYPSTTTVGAGIIRAWPTTVISTPTTYSSSQTVTDKVFTNLVTVNGGATVVFENCWFRGPLVRDTGSNLVSTTASALTTLRYCTVAPQTPSSYWNGIGYKNYRLEQCDFYGNVDNFAAFSVASDADPTVSVAIVGTWGHDLAQFKPDVAGARDVTHNDVIQCQGNVGDADDILIDGCRFDGYHSTTLSSPLPPEHIQVSAVMLTPNVRDRVCITVKRSWLTGGAFTLNGAKSQPNSIIVLDGNRWEKPHPSTGGPGAAIALSPTITNRTITNQTYADDGSTVPVYATA